MSTQKKCSGCKHMMGYDKFSLNNKGEYFKTCDSCREKSRIYMSNMKCEHGKRPDRCIDCGGESLCEHGRQRYVCKDCGGKSICEHGRVRNTCKDCKGGSICEHGKMRSACKDCKGGSICEHNKIRSTCKDCKGGSICEHGRHRRLCKDCDFLGHLSNLVRRTVYKALKSGKTEHSVQYLGCDIQTYRQYLESKFKPGMTWENQGSWHIDHIIPLKYDNGEELTLEETIKRLHYLNTQPLWATENIIKGNRYVG